MFLLVCALQLPANPCFCLLLFALSALSHNVLVERAGRAPNALIIFPSAAPKLPLWSCLCAQANRDFRAVAFNQTVANNNATLRRSLYFHPDSSPRYKDLLKNRWLRHHPTHSDHQMYHQDHRQLSSSRVSLGISLLLASLSMTSASNCSGELFQVTSKRK